MTPSKPFFFDGPATYNRAEYIAQALVDTMKEHDGIGLAAVQIGMMERVFCYLDDDAKDHENVLFNPKVVSYTGEWTEMDEGCLSFPGLIVKINRPKTITVAYQDKYAKHHEKTVDGMTARIWLHEMDHLEGILFYSLAKSVDRHMALKKWRKHNG